MLPYSADTAKGSIRFFNSGAVDVITSRLVMAL